MRLPHLQEDTLPHLRVAMHPHLRVATHPLLRVAMHLRPHPLEAAILHLQVAILYRQVVLPTLLWT